MCSICIFAQYSIYISLVSLIPNINFKNNFWTIYLVALAKGLPKGQLQPEQGLPMGQCPVYFWTGQPNLAMLGYQQTEKRGKKLVRVLKQKLKFSVMSRLFGL